MCGLRADKHFTNSPSIDHFLLLRITRPRLLTSRRRLLRGIHWVAGRRRVSRVPNGRGRELSRIRRWISRRSGWWVARDCVRVIPHRHRSIRGIPRGRIGGPSSSNSRGYRSSWGSSGIGVWRCRGWCWRSGPRRLNGGHRHRGTSVRVDSRLWRSLRRIILPRRALWLRASGCGWCVVRRGRGCRRDRH